MGILVVVVLSVGFQTGNFWWGGLEKVLVLCLFIMRMAVATS